MFSVLQEIEYHSGSSNGKQGNAGITTDQLLQQMDYIIPDTTLVENNDRNWSSMEIASENDFKILQHGNDPNDVSALRYAIRFTCIINFGL